MQLFVWLVLVHSVGTAEQIITIDESRFYYPKAILCTILNVCLVVERGYLSINRARDPSYWVDSDAWLTGWRITGAVFLFIYLCYFFMLSFALLIGNYQQMRKPYRYLIATTLTVVIISLLILFFNGRTSAMTNTPLYVAQYALYNVYMTLVAFLYAPSMEAHGDYDGMIGHIASVFTHPTQTDKTNTTRNTEEKEDFMDKFYEQELPELTDRSLDQELPMQETPSQRKRRDLKKNPGAKKAAKKKEELWASIEQQMEAEDEESSSEEEVV